MNRIEECFEIEYAEEMSLKVRAAVNARIAQIDDPDKVAWLEILREYLTDSDFRRKLADYTFEIING